MYGCLTVGTKSFFEYSCGKIKADDKREEIEKYF